MARPGPTTRGRPWAARAGCAIGLADAKQCSTIHELQLRTSATRRQVLLLLLLLLLLLEFLLCITTYQTCSFPSALAFD